MVILVLSHEHAEYLRRCCSLPDLRQQIADALEQDWLKGPAVQPRLTQVYTDSAGVVEFKAHYFDEAAADKAWRTDWRPIVERAGKHRSRRQT